VAARIGVDAYLSCLDDRSMRRLQGLLTVLAIAVGVGVAVQPGDAAVKARVDYDKTFDFTKLKTWSWNPAGAGQVVVGRTKDDNPEVVKQRAEPIIFDAVGKELPRRGLKPATGTADATLMYYLLLTVSSSGQTLGQFLPSVVQWGVPPFAPNTTSLEVIEQGSLVIDMMVNGKPVWRGIGEAKINLDDDQKKREALLRDGVRELLRRFPPKK
jgi:uncharacterized protein DUF4136